MDEQNIEYSRTQDAPRWVVTLASLFAIVVFSLITALARSEEGSAGLVLFSIVWITVVYLAVLSMTRMTIRITPTTIELTWRLGWPNKSIERASIVTAMPHRNHWLAGWGIRLVSRGWMWNVWGLDSVLLELDNGRVFRIGSDDVPGLLTALGR